MKNEVSAASSIYILTIERLLREIDKYEQMCANCVIMPKEFYDDLIQSAKEGSA